MRVEDARPVIPAAAATWPGDHASAEDATGTLAAEEASGAAAAGAARDTVAAREPVADKVDISTCSIGGSGTCRRDATASIVLAAAAAKGTTAATRGPIEPSGAAALRAA